VPEAETLPGNNRLEPVSHSDLGAPELRETQSFTRTATIPGIHDSEPMVRAAFALTDQHPTPSAPVSIGDDRYVIRLRERQVASREDFNRERDQRMSDAVLARRREVLQQYVLRLRAEAERHGDVRIGSSPLMRQATERTRAGGGSEAPQGS